MTPIQLKRRRHGLVLSCAKFAAYLGMKGRWDDRTIRRWESGKNKIPQWVDVKLGVENEL